MNKIGLIFPHQLFEKSELLNSCSVFYLIEESLFFTQFNFHKRKIAHHRASMKFYENYLVSLGKTIHYIESKDELADVRKLLANLSEKQIDELHYIDPTDNWLEKRIEQSANNSKINFIKHKSPLFLNSKEEIESYFRDKKRMFQTDFYKFQRKTKSILMESDVIPKGGKWTFDDENRLKYPKGKTASKIEFPKANKYHLEATEYVNSNFPENYGELDEHFLYPVTFEDSKIWLNNFFVQRFLEFGPYEDAIVSDEVFLNHSVLTPMLNIGLISPQFIIDEVLIFAQKNEVSINSLEGFVRQIIGWREFIRAVYELKGTIERTRNYWGFTRKIPQSFWEGTTGIEPLDDTIKKVLKTGYCHHIERLMIAGNFMVLCEFDPDEVYKWFMVLFIDSYDWVMVPNVYGMSQFADGGLMSTKPYISGSNYIMKMSNYKKGEWQSTWDGLFWRFMHINRSFFLQNPRLGMLVGSFDKMEQTKQNLHIKNAEDFLNSLS